MDTKQVILELRTQKGMSQDELAEKVFVSRQTVVEIKNDLIRQFHVGKTEKQFRIRKH